MRNENINTTSVTPSAEEGFYTEINGSAFEHVINENKIKPAITEIAGLFPDLFPEIILGFRRGRRGWLRSVDNVGRIPNQRQPVVEPAFPTR